MAPINESLPEGTDTIIKGASAGTPPSGTTFEPAGTGGATGSNGESGPPAGTSFKPEGAGGGVKEKIGEKTADLRSQATDKAREFATQGKDRAVSALENVVKLVDDAADTLDEKIGDQYGTYARRAAESISGVATTLREKDVDDLVRDAGDFVRKSPAIAIGMAAAVGFLIARVVKSASAPAEEDDRSKKPTAPTVPDRPAA